MKKKAVRSLEELWDLEDQYPLVGSNTGGLLRWLYATGLVDKPLTGNGKHSKGKSSPDSKKRNVEGPR